MLARTREFLKFQVLQVDNANDMRNKLYQMQGEQAKARQLASLYRDITVICNESNVGFAAGNNQGIRHALAQPDCHWIFVLNNDTRLESDTIEKLVEYAACHPRHLVSPSILYADGGRIQTMGGNFATWLGGTRNHMKNKLHRRDLPDQHPDFLSGCALLAPRALFEDCGMFDEDYFAYYEDADLGLRATRAGYTCVVLARTILWHRHSGSLAKLSHVKTYLLMRNSVLFAQKQLPSLHGALFIAVAICAQFVLNTVQQRSIAFLRFWWEGILDGFAHRRRYP